MSQKTMTIGGRSMSALTAYDIKRALARRHRDDLYFTEVKNGPTQTVRHHAKIDALAIRISWTNYAIIGYEVKVSKSDFRRDEKWMSYLPMCNQLYFVVAPGVCDMSEIPENCGLIQATDKGGLRTVKKAPWRDIDEPVNMYKYLMFNYIGADWDRKLPRHEQLLAADRANIFREYSANKVELKDLGRAVGKKIGREIRDLREKASNYDSLKANEDSSSAQMRVICAALGVEPFRYSRQEECLKAIAQLKSSGGVSLKVLEGIKRIHAASGKALAELSPAEEGGA